MRPGHAGYMSPEQAEGRPRPASGPRSRRLQPGRDALLPADRPAAVRGDDVGEVLRAVQRGEFPPPRQLDPSIDRALEAVCLKAMAHRARRTATPRRRALADDIERWLADEPVSAWREPLVAASSAVGEAQPDGGDRRGGAPRCWPAWSGCRWSWSCRRRPRPRRLTRGNASWPPSAQRVTTWRWMRSRRSIPGSARTSC